MAKKTNSTNGGHGQKQAFAFSASGAVSVQLVGDFTHWQERPINLQKGADGVWRTAVELKPGTHHYRFIVDGEWQDDPRMRSSRAESVRQRRHAAAGGVSAIAFV